MRISLLLALMMGTLLLGGIGDETLRGCHIPKKTALFFLFCTVLMDRFLLAPNDETEVSAACIFCAVWLFGNAFADRNRIALALLSIPVSIVIGAVTAPLYASDSELALYAAAAVPALTALAFGLHFALAAASLSPAAASIFAFASSSSKLPGLSITEACLTAQLAGVFLSALFLIAYNSISKASAARVKSVGR